MRKRNDEVTVVIPTRDRTTFLGAAIESVLAQTRPVDRLVVVDNSQKIPQDVEQLCHSYGPNVVEYRGALRNLSLSENHQRALAEATSPFVSVMQDDDVYTPTFVERALAAFEVNTKASLFAVNYGVIDETGSLIQDQAWPNFRSGILSTLEFLSYAIETMSPVHLSASMFRREASVSTAFYETDTTCSDMGFFLRVACAGPVILVDEPLALIRQHGHSSSSAQGWGAKDNSLIVSVFPLEWGVKDRFLRSTPGKQALGDNLASVRKRATKRLLSEYVAVIRSRESSTSDRITCARSALRILMST